MRTCPACGEDTEAETTQPCTECGFSPVGTGDEASFETTDWSAETPQAPPPPPAQQPPAQQPPAPGQEPPAPTDPQPQYGFPEPTPEPAEKSKPRVAPIWIVLILIGIAWQGFNLFNGCGGIFGSNPGPTADEAESALESDAALQGVEGPAADCPDSAEDTEVGETFDCTLSNLDGESATIVVTNRDDSFEWSRASFTPLIPPGGASPLEQTPN